MQDTIQAACEVMARVRSQRPLIHHITNFVVMNATANITLCLGALPVMAHAPEEVEEMVGAAGALVLNLGTLWPAQVEAMLLAGRRANERGIPIVLDPVGAGATRLRTESAHRLLKELSISIVRGNLAEIATLAGMESKIRGVESVGPTGDAELAASQFAKKFGCVAAVTGPIDVVTDGARLMRVANGHPMMATVTGTGCMATSVVAACAAVENDAVIATAAALAAYGLAGELAAEKAEGPGTFQVHLFDAVAGLTEDALRAGMRIDG
ncbi:MAG: hydroxyethylthiazole kinase [Acidobacteriaceae bacterium]